MKVHLNVLAFGLSLATIAILSAFKNPYRSSASFQDDKVYDTVDVQPKFPGGDAGWLKFIRGYRYPAEAVERGVSGKITLTFVVEKDGRLTNIVVDKSPRMGTDRAAVDLFNKSPKWEPGLVNGQPVRTRFKQTISLHLQAQNRF